ncbi:MAG TPA: DinB family protein [Candidatus Limnocylindrales bacterium]|nr:DinB family protein [Candidatus Limnocylindrales bacterium]
MQVDRTPAGPARAIDFGPVRDGELELIDLGRGMTAAALAAETRALVAQLRALFADALDPDVTFVPDDPQAADTFAADPTEEHLAWTAGHVVVHLTASAEEAAFLAAELARGVEAHGRSRWEVPWTTMTTVADCRQRLDESERMLLATLDAWPDAPHLDVVFVNARGSVRNAPARFLGGLMHADEHLGQVAEILRQARVSRG